MFLDLFRLFGYEITAQRLVDVEDFVEPRGGQLDRSQTIVNALATSLSTAEGSDRLIKVALRVDTTPARRTSPMRDQAMAFGFAQTDEAGVAARGLATQLSRSMDRRSKDCLFLIAAYRESANAPNRRVAMWMFPQDDAFRFSPGEQNIEFLTDIFSRTSGLRKLALFAGRDAPTSFLQADVLDYQLGRGGDVADFWVERFLDATLAMLPATGTRMLADALKKAADQDDLTSEERDQINAAAIALQPLRKLTGASKKLPSASCRGEQPKSFWLLHRQMSNAQRCSKSSLRSTRGRWRGGLSDSLTVFSSRHPWSRSARIPATDAVVRLAPDDDAAGARERLRIEADVLEDRLTSRHHGQVISLKPTSRDGRFYRQPRIRCSANLSNI